MGTMHEYSGWIQWTNAADEYTEKLRQSIIDYFADQLSRLDGYNGWIQRMDTMDGYNGKLS